MSATSLWCSWCALHTPTPRSSHSASPLSGRVQMSRMVFLLLPPLREIHSGSGRALRVLTMFSRLFPGLNSSRGYRDGPRLRYAVAETLVVPGIAVVSALVRCARISEQRSRACYYRRWIDSMGTQYSLPRSYSCATRTTAMFCGSESTLFSSAMPAVATKLSSSLPGITATSGRLWSYYRRSSRRGGAWSRGRILVRWHRIVQLILVSCVSLSSAPFPLLAAHLTEYDRPTCGARDFHDAPREICREWAVV